MKIFLKVILYSVAVFIIFDVIQYGFPSGIKSGVLEGTIYGVIFGVTAGSYHIWTLKRMQKKFGKNKYMKLGVYQYKNISIYMSYDEAYQLCIKSLNLVRKCKIIKKDYSEGIIVARVSMTMKSFGEYVTIKINKRDNKKTLIGVYTKYGVGSRGLLLSLSHKKFVGKRQKSIGNSSSMSFAFFPLRCFWLI